MNDFSRRLIKGKIAEIIFQQMFSNTGKFTIIPFGYEYTTPELSQHEKNDKAKEVIDNIRNAPDFALISKNGNSVYLVEVKYRSKIELNKIIEIASAQNKRWSPSYLFVASLNGFYFDNCHNIINIGKISKLKENWVEKNLQNTYLGLLREFER
jgi:hypothetical protein